MLGELTAIAHTIHGITPVRRMSGIAAAAGCSGRVAPRESFLRLRVALYAMTQSLSDYDYELPADRIAQMPSDDRAASRLLVLQGERIIDSTVRELPGWLQAGDLLVFNDSRVIHARLLGRKATGGQVEMLVERIIGAHEVLAMVRASKTPQPGSTLELDGGVHATVLGRVSEFLHLRLADVEGASDALTLIERHGCLPLPPYIERGAAAVDESRYQTVYAREPGSVAAPTAGLHFDEPLLDVLRGKGVGLAWVTLHVGAGTFQPVRVEALDKHAMHGEWWMVPQATVDAVAAARAAGRRVVAVGTTALRALESAAESGAPRAGSAETRLFVRPGYRFRVIDALMTNFHLPKSTLLMLVSALGGFESIRAAYRHAIDKGYRFFSYGDAMLIDPGSGGARSIEQVRHG
jgi:S-adenosylmethionine:tRNA ribosyltransferase-isomerase